MKFIDLIPLISSIFVFSLGFIVLSKNKKSRINFTFFLHSVSIAFWLFATFMMFINQNVIEKAIFWDKIVYSGVVFIPAFMYHFGLAYTKKNRNILLYLAYILSFFFCISVFSGYFVDDIFQYKWGVHTKAQILHHFFLVYFVLYVVLWFINIFIYYKKIASSIAKEQARYIIIGFLVLFSIGPLAYLPAYGIGIYPFSYISGVLFTIIISYAIIKYRLLNIKFVLRQSSVYIISLIVIFFLASVIKIVITKYFGEFVFWMDLMIIFFAVATFPYLKNKFFKLANEYFFTSLYDSQKLILQTGNELKTVLNIERVYDFLFSVFIKNFHIKAFGVLTYNESGKNYILQYNQNFKARKGDIFDRNLVVENAFIAQNQIVITEELKNLYYSDETKGLISLLENLEVELLIPLKIKGAPIGLLAMGGKETDEAYNEEDLKVLEIIAAQAAVAIENAQLYSEVQRFNIRLKKEIRKATEDLNTTNYELSSSNKKLSIAYKKLKQLDSAKNEFISIASHQLRTPLTSIKGFISLIREGDYGKISKQVDGALKKIFISNERLIKLVNDILNLSRIESGTFTFNFGKNDLTAMIKNVVEDFSLEVEERGLKIKFNKPEKKIPLFVFDRDKMQEVISNLIDNAIKYTTAGKIEVDIKDFERKIRIIISDTGKGMEEDEAKYVFEKFRRGVGSSSLNTEGTGLGLYVCKKIMNAHDGNIFAKSDGPEKGSQFIVELKKDLKMGKEK